MKLFARIFIGLSILSGYDSYSQTARTLTGIVTSVDERAPLEGVTVATKDGSNISGTQADGIYYITITPTDSILVFSYPDFQTEEIRRKASRYPGNTGPGRYFSDVLLGMKSPSKEVCY